jgi:flagellar basal-body rod protein FlgG
MIMGPLNKTDRPEDLALGSQGFFAVQTPEGERYTRNGHFQLDETGTLKTTEGFEVLGLNGAITGLTPSFTVKSDGTVNDKNVNIAQLRIVDMPIANLKREGQSLYSATQTPALANANTLQVLQGTIENSNVDLAGQMEKMIIVMRAYEANQKVIQTQDATLEKAVNEVGKL